MAENVKVYEEQTTKARSPWAWLIPLLLLLVLGVWFLNRRRDQPVSTASAVHDTTKPDSGMGAQTASSWTAASIADSIRSKGRVGFGDGDVHFATGSATLAADSQAVLDQTAQALNSNADWKMRVVGHTDSVGSSAANEQLSQQRARSVMAYLTAHGVAADRLSVDAKGGNQPVSDNASDSGRAENRRVELIKI